MWDHLPCLLVFFSCPYGQSPASLASVLFHHRSLSLIGHAHALLFSFTALAPVSSALRRRSRREEDGILGFRPRWAASTPRPPTSTHPTTIPSRPTSQIYVPSSVLSLSFFFPNFLDYFVDFLGFLAIGSERGRGLAGRGAGIQGVRARGPPGGDQGLQPRDDRLGERREGPQRRLPRKARRRPPRRSQALLQAVLARCPAVRGPISSSISSFLYVCCRFLDFIAERCSFNIFLGFLIGGGGRGWEGEAQEAGKPDWMLCRGRWAASCGGVYAKWYTLQASFPLYSAIAFLWIAFGFPLSSFCFQLFLWIKSFSLPSWAFLLKEKAGKWVCIFLEKWDHK